MGQLKFKQRLPNRLASRGLMQSLAIEGAKEQGSQPRTIEERLQDNAKLSPFDTYETFNKSVERALSSRAAASGQFAIPLPDQTIVDYRPDDNDAFIKNSIFGAENFLRTGVGNAGDFTDLNRTVGIFPKEDVQATITIQTFVEGSAPIAVTNQFILASVSESSQEKYQIYQTFDEDLIYFFDRNPHIYTYGGVLYNADKISDTTTFQWKNRFQRLYETTLRGTKCVENNARAILTYEDVTRQGYLLNFQMSEDASNPINIPFSFLFYVTKEDNNVQDNSLRPIETASDESSNLQKFQAKIRDIQTQRRASLEARTLRVLSGNAGIATGNVTLPFPGEAG